jgi:hypothetical protein
MSERAPSDDDADYDLNKEHDGNTEYDDPDQRE